MSNPEKSESIERLTYVVAHEEVIGIGSAAADPEELDEIVELAVDVAADGDGALHRLHIPLLDQDRPRLLAQSLHFRLHQRLALHQVLDLAVQIGMRRRHRSLSLSLSLLGGFSRSVQVRLRS